MGSEAIDMTNASSVLGGLSSLSAENPELSTALSLGSLVTGVFGSIFGSEAAEKAHEETIKYRKAVLKDLSQISNKLSQIETELGGIDTELKAIYKAIEESNNISIADQLAIIDSSWENFAALDPAKKENQASLKTYALDVFNPTGSVLNAMNTINEVLMSHVFSTGSAFQGQLSIAGYMYLKSKMLQGLYMMGYACCFTGDDRDFGSYFLTWSQNFADQMKAIIAHSKANSLKAGPYTAEFHACWGGFSGNGFDESTPLYCTDSLCFSAGLTPIMAQTICGVEVKNDGGLQLLLDGVGSLLENHYMLLPTGDSSPIPYFVSGWNYNIKGSDGNPAMGPVSVTNNNGNSQEVTFTNPNLVIQMEPGQVVTYPWPVNYSLDVHSPAPTGGKDVNKRVVLAPFTNLCQGSDIYLGSADGMLNIIPDNFNGGNGTLAAFLYDGGRKENLLQVLPKATTVEDVTLGSLTTLTNCAVQITFDFSEFPAGTNVSVTIKFVAADLYLSIGASGWETSTSPVRLTVSAKPKPQMIQSPYDMDPVPITLTQGGNSKVVLVHMSPFD